MRRFFVSTCFFGELWLLSEAMRKQKRLAVFAGVLLGVGLLWQAPNVFADSGYPYGGKPCIWMPYASSGVRAQWCPDYDWGDMPEDESAANVISPYGYYYRNCTDYTAWKVSTLGIDVGLYTGLGNAKDWAVRAQRKGLRVDGTPAPGAVAVRTTGQYGHTAFIEAVEPGGALKVSHYNYRGDGNYSEQFGTDAQFGFSAFIHFEDLIPAPPPPIIPPDPAPPADPEPVAPDPAIPAEPEPAPPDSAGTEPELLSATTEDAAFEEAIPPPQPDEVVESVPDPVIPQPEPDIRMAVATTTTAPAAADVQAMPVAVTPVPTADGADSAPPSWRKAAESPPTVPATATIHQYAAQAQPIPSAGDDASLLWPIIGLVALLFVQQAMYSRANVRGI